MVANAPHFRDMTRKEAFANRDLIAAAPELLAALNDMLSLLGDAGTEDAETWQPGQNWIFEEDKVSAKNRITSARAAIAKAEGKA